LIKMKRASFLVYFRAWWWWYRYRAESAKVVQF
jgi:hypothetical protein